jgi:hypothetical protein
MDCRSGHQGVDDGAMSLENGPRPSSLANSRPPATGAPLELVSEVGDEILDLKVVHDALATLLVRYHQNVRADIVGGRTE